MSGPEKFEDVPDTGEKREETIQELNNGESCLKVSKILEPEVLKVLKENHNITEETLSNLNIIGPLKLHSDQIKEFLLLTPEQQKEFIKNVKESESLRKKIESIHDLIQGPALQNYPNVKQKILSVCTVGPDRQISAFGPKTIDSLITIYQDQINATYAIFFPGDQDIDKAYTINQDISTVLAYKWYALNVFGDKTLALKSISTLSKNEISIQELQAYGNSIPESLKNFSIRHFNQLKEKGISPEKLKNICVNLPQCSSGVILKLLKINTYEEIIQFSKINPDLEMPKDILKISKQNVKIIEYKTTYNFIKSLSGDIKYKNTINISINNIIDIITNMRNKKMVINPKNIQGYLDTTIIPYLSLYSKKSVNQINVISSFHEEFGENFKDLFRYIQTNNIELKIGQIKVKPTFQFIHGMLELQGKRRPIDCKMIITEYQKKLTNFLSDKESYKFKKIFSFQGEDATGSFKNIPTLIGMYENNFGIKSESYDSRTNPKGFINNVQNYSLTHPGEKVLVCINMHGSEDGNALVSTSPDGSKIFFTPAHFTLLSQIPNIVLEVRSCYSGSKFNFDKNKLQNSVFLSSENQTSSSSLTQNSIEAFSNLEDDQNFSKADFDKDGKVSYQEQTVYKMLKYKDSIIPSVIPSSKPGEKPFHLVSNSSSPQSNLG